MFNKEFEAMPEKKIKELQLERLKWSITHAYENNSFYRKTYDEAGFHPDQFKSLDDMKRVPFLTKEQMRSQYPYGLFAVPLKKIVRIHSSSGTTGNATVVGYTKNDIEVFSEVIARCLVSYGVTEDDIIQVAYGYGLFTGGLGLHYGSEKLGALTIPIGGGNTERQLMMIKDLGTTVLTTTPSYALNIADFIEKKMPGYDIGSTNLRLAVLGAEPWTGNMRDEIEERLGISAYDLYGLSEVIGPGVSCECSAKSGLHVQEDHFYVEIIDPKTGEILPEGEKGEIVYTSITKEGFPNIRYRSKDITRLYRDGCSCGRTLVKMEKVSGRSDDMLIIRGVNVFPSQIEAVLLEFRDLEPHYQVVVERVKAMDEVEVRVEVNGKVYSQGEKTLSELNNKVRQKIKSALGITVKVSLIEPMGIPRSEGKAVRVIDKRKLV